MVVEYFVRGLVFLVPRPSDECPDHKARVRLSPSCFPCSHVWLHSDSASFSNWVFPGEIAVAEISHRTALKSSFTTSVPLGWCEGGENCAVTTHLTSEESPKLTHLGFRSPAQTNS